MIIIYLLINWMRWLEIGLEKKSTTIVKDELLFIITYIKSIRN
jgi:hypothetical protein